MTLKYGNVDSITKRLAGRITVVNVYDYGITGITGTQIGTDLIEIIGQDVEEWIEMFLGMLYELPLANNHPFLQAIVDKLVISEIYLSYFPTTSETSDTTDNFANIVRKQALNNFQCLFNGLGMFVPGADVDMNQVQNDENKQQMSSKAIILPGEKLKKFIGYDYDGDSISDTDLYKLNTNVAPSFYTTGDFEDLQEGLEIVNNIRVRPRRNYDPTREEINFY